MKFVSVEKISPYRSKRIRLILLGSVLLSILFVYFHPLNLINYFFPGLMRSDSSCIMLNITGLPCPFCGMSRSFKELMSFNLSGSFYYNPSAIFVIAFMGIFFLCIFALSLFNYGLKFKFTGKTFLVLMSVILIVWIINVFFGHI